MIFFFSENGNQNSELVTGGDILISWRFDFPYLSLFEDFPNIYQSFQLYEIHTVFIARILNKISGQSVAEL